MKVSHLLEVLGSQTGIPKGLKKKMENSGGEEGLTILEFGGHWGDEDFGIFEDKAGLKYSCRPR